MIEWLNNLHPTVNALVVVLGSTTALLTLAAALRSCWRAGRRLFRRHPKDPNKVERNERMRERGKPRFREPPSDKGQELATSAIPGSELVFRPHMTLQETITLMEKHATKDMILKDPVLHRRFLSRGIWDKAAKKAPRDDAMDALAYFTEAQARASEEWIKNPLMVLDEATQKPRRATDKEVREYKEKQEQEALRRQAQSKAAAKRAAAPSLCGVTPVYATPHGLQEALQSSRLITEMQKQNLAASLTPGKIVTAKQCAQCKGPIPSLAKAWRWGLTHHRFCSRVCAEEHQHLHDKSMLEKKMVKVEADPGNTKGQPPPNPCLGAGFQHLVNYDTLRCCSCNKVIYDIERDDENWKFAK